MNSIETLGIVMLVYLVVLVGHRANAR